jgi:GTP-binding protein
MTFTIAIIGRPNVGKSTLFNKMAGKKLAIVDDRPGVTRDWREADAQFFDLKFKILDTAGLEEKFDQSMEGRMRQTTEAALKRADLALMVIDGRAGVTPLDQHFADWLRKQPLKTILIVNKCESDASQAGALEAYALGLGEPIIMSAEHGIGFTDLYSVLKELVPDEETENDGADDDGRFDFEEGAEKGFGDLEDEESAEVKPIKLAIVGRPNAGKSTLINSLLGEERVMTGPEPGVTRDAIAVEWIYDDKPYILVDTAGMRKKSKIVDRVEKMAVEDSLRAIRLAQVVVLVVDSQIPLEHQDLNIAHHVASEGRALVVAVNKWDMVEDKSRFLDDLKHKVAESIAQVPDVPVVPLSALHGKGLGALMHAVSDVYLHWNKRVQTWKLNRYMRYAENHHPPPMVNGRANRLRYMTQIKTRPPTFALWVSKPDDFPESYERYLMNGIRQEFDIKGTVVRLYLRQSKNPYAD